LSNSDYFLGELSLTDIAIVPRALRMETYGALPSPSLRRLEAWLQRMKERPSVSRLL
jgi:glutathione S-transferase